MFNYNRKQLRPGRLGRYRSDDLSHIAKYPFSDVAPVTVASVERALTLPWWHWRHDQGDTGSCVGHGVAMERAITNREQNRLAILPRPWAERYDPIWTWDNAKLLDEWPDTNPGDDNGTSVHAGYQVAHTLGMVKVTGIKLENDIPVPYGDSTPDLGKGVAAYRWASSVDEVRTSISQGMPVTIGIDWYSNFDNPVSKGGYPTQYWIGEGPLGVSRGGHCLVIYGASDKRQAFKLKNSWGKGYPLVWIPYTTVERLILNDGEFAIVTDR
jgi:hypothetical protein